MGDSERSGGARRGLPIVLQDRQFRLWFAGSSLSALGSAMVPVTVTFAVLTRFHTASAVGTVLAAETAPLALLLLFGGVAADRVSRRLLLLTGDVISTVVQTLAAVLLVVGGWQLWQLAALFALQGAATGLAAPALIGMVADVVPPAGHQQANTLRSLAGSGAGIAGPALAGVVAGFGGGGVGLAVNAGTYAVSALALGLMAPVAAAAGERSSMLRELGQGWREFRSRAWLWSIVAQFSLFHLLVYPPVMVLGAVVADRSYGGATAWGALLGTFGVGSVAGGLLMLRWRPARPLLVAIVAGAGFAVLAAALAGPAPVLASGVAAFVAGAVFAVFDVLWNTAMTTHVPPRVLSRVSAYDWFGSVVLLPVGYAIVGPLAAAFGVADMLWIAAAAWVAASVAVLGVRDVRTMQRLG